GWQTSTSSTSWVSVSSGQGSGNGTASFSFASNTTGTARAAVIIMGEQILRVVQGVASGTVPPGVPILTSPSDGATGVSVTPTLHWSVASSASSYSVYLGTGSSLTLIDTVNGTAYTPQALSPGTAYSWQVGV